ncbi:hypothetical protein QYM36_016845 [Artemia franciscana]|uniref:Uncharacterized protein n=1 Tax=Artemia franciscana TaxID=6661 RepID=A0AA88H968_ARTSF|nr:hypothetical protein QYM36_016845 [Artemia franciscana]
MKSLKRNDVRCSNSSGEETNDSSSVSIKDREWNGLFKALFTERMKRYTHVREAIENMRDKARTIEELFIMGSTDIDWESTVAGRCDKRKDKELTKEPPSKKHKQLTENYEDMEKFSDNLFLPLSKPVHGANNPFNRNTSTAQTAKILNNIEKNVTEKDKTPQPININLRSDTVVGNVIDGVKNDHISKKKNKIPSKEPWQNIYHPPSLPTLLLERSLHYSRKYLTEQLNARDGLGNSKDSLSITQQIESKERQSDETGNSLTSKSASHPSRHAQSFSLLVRRMESLLFWSIRMGKLGPPLELKNAAETLTEKSSQYKPGVRNGVYRNSTRLSKTQLSQMRRANMLKNCHGVDDLKTVEPRVKRKYVKKPKEEKKTENRRSSQRNKT